MIFSVSRVRSLLAVAVVIGAGGCATEVAINGRFPARFPEAAQLHLISMLDFAGNDGASFGSTLRSTLLSAEFDGARVFSVVDAGARPRGRSVDAARYGRDAGAQGVFTGSASITSGDQPYQGTSSRCVENDNRGRCLRSVPVTIYCTRRTLTLAATTSLVRSADGTVVYSSDRSQSQATSWCEGQTRQQTDEAVAQTLRQRLANEIRRDVAPYVAVLQATLKESPSGLPQPYSAEFKRGVEAAKAGNFGGACGIWAAVDAAAPNHTATVYNLGVCAEAGGDYATAVTLYQRSLDLSGGADRMIVAALVRVNQLINAGSQLAQDQQRSAPPPPPPARPQPMCTVRDPNSGMNVRRPC